MKEANVDIDSMHDELRQQILDNIDLSKEVTDDELVPLIHEVINNKSRETYISLRQREFLKKKIFNSLRRLDILQELIEDKGISEIMINGTNNIFIERHGRISRWDYNFESVQKLQDVIQQITSKTNRMVNELNPIVDSRLDDGSRVNIVLPPVSLDGPIVTIRKFPEETMTMERLIGIGSVTREASEFLRRLVRSGYNIFISGGTGSGKTTFLNALSNFIPDTERIITIEDSAELQIRNIPNLVRLEVRNSNVEGKNEITIRDLIKSSLRMRPDRIVVGEVRDAAAIDMLQALNTGHNGMSTGHANSPKDMLSRLETMVLLGTAIPLLAVRRQIASAIDIIIHLGRLRDKTRKVLEIMEILDCVDGDIKLNALYTFEETGEDEDGNILGELAKTGNDLINTQKLKHAGFYGNSKL